MPLLEGRQSTSGWSALDTATRLARTMRHTSLSSWLTVCRFPAPPILIGGCGRSGTTLLLSVLAAHPSIVAIPFETGLFSRTFDRPLRTIDHRQRLLRAQLLAARQPISSTARRWCEKTPRNVLGLPILLRDFGAEVRFIHIVRDGRDVVASRHPAQARAGVYVDLDRWVRDVSTGLAFAHDPRVYTLRYEDLVQTPRVTLETLLSWLEEPWSAFLDDYQRHTGVKQSKAWAHDAKPISTSSVAKWRTADHTNIVEAFSRNEEASGLLARLGYPVN